MQIRVERLRVRHENFELRVDNLHFSANRVSALVGPNGAGKSTLLKALSGVIKPVAGSIFVDGRELSRLRGSERARLVSYVPQEHSTALNFRVFDFILMGRSGYLNIFSPPARADYEKTEEVISYLGLEALAARKCQELSSGERRIVLIARALAQDSKIILLDEPTTFLDLKHEMEIINLLRKLAEDRGKTIITSVHSIDLIPRLADFLVMIKNGQILSAGPTTEIFRAELLGTLFDYPLRVVEADGRQLILR
ncbi:MAG: ABC transporter, ATP-binding protein [Candidatus Saccharicenans subterraneus]|uniref:ABC transporter, ATP-binding protein n=1 Tax=Candidatus Saccharicenans subterraneus TaxID=2508984 RepID=A0A3E2BMR1_9BACT|nr:MAG: ABC transporter, ATP-binding protein [Candidatus Saccharicenans subterraneum]